MLLAEFWKQVPPNEPYRVILGDVRDKLYNTRERSRHLLSSGISEIPEEATFTNVEQVCSFFCDIHISDCSHHTYSNLITTFYVTVSGTS